MFNQSDDVCRLVYLLAESWQPWGPSYHLNHKLDIILAEFGEAKGIQQPQGRCNQRDWSWGHRTMLAACSFT